MKRWLDKCLLLIMVTLPLHGRAESLEVPVALKQGFLQQLIIQQLFAAEAGQPVRVWDDGKDCNYLELSDPELTLEESKVRTRSAASAQIGTAIAGRCMSVLDWQGLIEIVQAPALGIDPGTVRFRVIDSKVYATDGESAGAVGTVWEWVKRHVHPRFERLQVDINPLLTEMRTLLPMLYPDQPEPIKKILQSVALNGVTVEAEKLRLQLKLDLPRGFASTPELDDQPPLTQSEIERWERSWQQWDAFVTYFIKQAGHEAVTAEIRTDLLAVLIEARQDLLPILTGPVQPGVDPVPELFVTTWQRLEPVLRGLSEQLPPNAALRYLTFMAAADALSAIEAVGTQTGFTLSADALRRLARLANPSLAIDPLQYQIDVDPDLRDVFGFGPPIPRLPLRPQSSLPTDTMQWSPHGAFGGMLMAALPTLVLNDNHYITLVERLNGWAPTISVLDEYLPLMQQLLDRIVGLTLNNKKVEREYIGLFRPLVLATAWQESCWRQYIKQGDEIKTLSSNAGAIGIMQVNQHVWRGFYELDALLNDVGYNALAGAEILHHYLVDYAIPRKEDQHSGGLDNLARAAYAMYNGGPRQIDRYRREQTKRPLRLIDQSFWKKYQQVQEGDPLVVSECYTG